MAVRAFVLADDDPIIGRIIPRIPRPHAFGPHKVDKPEARVRAAQVLGQIYITLQIRPVFL